MIKKIFCFIFIILNIKSIEDEFNIDDQIDFETSIYNNLSDEELNFDYDNQFDNFENNLENNNYDDLNEDDFYDNKYQENSYEEFDQYDEKISEYSNFICNFLKDKLLIWENFIINEEINNEANIDFKKNKDKDNSKKTKNNKKKHCKCLKK